LDKHQLAGGAVNAKSETGAKDDPPAEPRILSRSRRALLALATLCLTSALGCGTAMATPSPALHFPAVSSNWAGYAATATSGSSLRFKSVSAHWVQPSVTCAGRPAYAGFWVGLGGYRRSANALEQIGTEADCSSSGGGNYYAWYELVPRGPVMVSLTVHPGDTIAASVTVAGRRVVLALRDLTTRASSLTRQRASAIDVSSAEWIAEAPSLCLGENCRVLPLADFGSVSFSGASATTTNGDSGAIGASSWSLSALELLDLSGDFGNARFGRPQTVATAAPTSLTSSGTAFTVAWKQVSAPSGSPAPIGPFSR
jgi:hypothetical protein